MPDLIPGAETPSRRDPRYPGIAGAAGERVPMATGSVIAAMAALVEVGPFPIGSDPGAMRHPETADDAPPTRSAETRQGPLERGGLVLP
jgi:hypothetical protein